MAEEQPVAARRADRAPLLQESPERRDAGAGSDHDDRHRISRQAEGTSFLHIDAQLAAKRATFGKIGRGHAQPRALAYVVAHGIDSERNAAGIGLG